MTTTERTEADVVAAIEEAAGELRTGNPGLTREQAFVRVLAERRDLRHELAEARQRDRTPALDGNAMRFGDAMLGPLSNRLRQQKPHLTETAANVAVLRSQPVLRELLYGR
jgi:hypothetical protein